MVDPKFDPLVLLRVLVQEGVEFVVIGGVAASLYGAPHVTFDLDITPARGRANLNRLARALARLEARIRSADRLEGLAADLDAEHLARGSVLNLVTSQGNLDLAFEPVGTAGYPDLKRRREILMIEGVEVPVASLADVIRSKEAAGRDKDLLLLPTLRRLLDHLTDADA